jgi:transcriptional accessory protein Tex/SPT6
LDDTRIHPDDYGFARKMAADALDEEEDEGSSQVEAIIRRPQKLEDIGTYPPPPTQHSPHFFFFFFFFC